jgi:hypothetical protein
MSTIFEAYNYSTNNLVAFYQRINKEIAFSDGMITSLGIIYWGKPKHQAEMEKTIPVLREQGIDRFSELYTAIRTPTRARKFTEQTGISKDMLRILKHDLELWLPKVVPLPELGRFYAKPEHLRIISHNGLTDQLAVISAGQTLSQRKEISLQTGLKMTATEEIVKLCDYYRTGKNLEHIRAKLYYEIGLDTWQKWASQTAEGIITKFAEHVKENHLEGERLIPWPKEVRNGIEWAKMHLEVFAVQW